MGFRIDVTYAEYEAFQKVVAMLTLANLTNYKREQDAFPRLLNAVKLVLAIDDNADQNPGDKIVLSPKTRDQLDAAVDLAEK